MADDRWKNADLSFLALSPHNLDAWHACRPIWHLLCQQAWERFITGLVLPHLPSSFRHDSTLRSHPLRNLFSKQGISTRADQHRWSQRCSGVMLQHTPASASVPIASTCESPVEPNTSRSFKRSKWQFLLCFCAGLPWMCGKQM